MVVCLSKPCRITAVSYRLDDAPDFETSKGGYLVRPHSCEVKWFNGAIGKVEVTGNVVSRKTGQIGNRLASETFMIIPAAEGEEVPESNRFKGPDFVIEIYEAAKALGETPSRDA
ncbi:hypothetical protein QE364_000126 [Nocardioides zeae]|uniref:Uncharacterized protein n=1 Tax=Nocardioides zeae TaxID=1457234 RepID=A0ACC6ICS9_9ACTN|nr:hypothetical protein [Nocardioides zeae]MDR6175507.1 hypothetical protein [Nocardioides zeae]MDR6208438.1 hypothetical protein [Nocardioides zeae]